MRFPSQDPLVDVTIAVHSADRPISRAVSSVINHTQAPVRVNVVAHNIDLEVIRSNLGPLVSNPQVRLLTHRDNIASPAGPMNHGFASSTAPFLALLGSDDEFAPGAIDSWLELQRETKAEFVISRVRSESGQTDPYPPTRWGCRSKRLDGAKDRLAYRSAPLGLINRQAFKDLRFTEGLASGEDLAYSLTIWFNAKCIAYDVKGPGYQGREDAKDRVTSAPRSVSEDFEFLDTIEDLPWFRVAPSHVRTAIIVKIMRIHFFDAVRARLGSQEDIERELSDLVDLLDRLEKLSPRAFALLSLADHSLIKLLRHRQATRESLLAALDARYNYASTAAIFPRNPSLILHRQAPLRTLATGRLHQLRR